MTKIDHFSPLVISSFLILIVINYSHANSVIIKNYGSKLISCQCSSKDDKLEYKDLKLNEVYTFKFWPNIWGNTLFWCTVSYFTEDKSFVVYGQNRKDYHNTYVVDSTGIVHYNTNEYIHFWTKHQN